MNRRQGFFIPSCLARWAASNRPKVFCSTMTFSLFTWLAVVMVTTSMACWMLLDGSFYQAIPKAFVRYQMVPLSSFANQIAQAETKAPLRLLLFETNIAAIVALLILIGVGMVFGSIGFRNIRTYFGVTGLVACWLFFGQECEFIVETGRRWRLTLVATSVDRFATRLNSDWSELCNPNRAPAGILNPVSMQAYPRDNPTLCFFPKSVPVGRTPLEIASIERTEGEAIRLQLAGANRGYWIERRFDQKLPRPFVSGLEYRLAPEEITKIGESLYLVRYRE